MKHVSEKSQVHVVPSRHWPDIFTRFYQLRLHLDVQRTRPSRQAFIFANLLLFVDENDNKDIRGSLSEFATDRKVVEI